MPIRYNPTPTITPKMAFTAEIGSTAQLLKALAVIREVKGVMEAKRQ